MTGETADVIVVGAGLSGLSAAKLLQEHDFKVTVLEARDRVGGRTFTLRNDKVDYVDLGGAYVGPTQNRILRLADEFEIKTFLTNEKEDLVYYRKGRSHRFRGAFPPMGSFLASLDINNLFRLMDKMGEEIPPEAPWKAPHAEEWDNITCQQFFDKHIWTEAARTFATKFINVNVTSEPYECSLLWFLWYVKQCGGVDRIFSTTNGGQISYRYGTFTSREVQRQATEFVRVNVTSEPYECSLLWFLWYVSQAGGANRINSTENGAQERKFIGGSQQISECIVKKLGKDNVKLECPVCYIQHDKAGVTVKDIHGNIYMARYVVLANPLPLQNKITYDPSLPYLRNQLIQRVPMGSVIKTFLYYKTPFWREKGYCGSAAIDDDNAIVGFCLDDVKYDGQVPALMGFILADRARNLAFLTKEERMRHIAQVYSRVFQTDEAKHPIHYEEKNWMEEQWSGGCYTVMMPPGFLTKFGRELRKPIGKLHFAGTETSSYWSGYMEGAVEAGERAAREILCEEKKIPESQIWQTEPENSKVKPRPFQSTFFERYAPSVGGFMWMMGITLAAMASTTAAVVCRTKFHR